MFRHGTNLSSFLRQKLSKKVKRNQENGSRHGL
nr:MAG TPA: hypothetical protein [Caudoviricetes sp.]